MKNGILQMEDATMDYISFGKGGRVLIILPGLGDGLRTVKGTALPMALLYRAFGKAFTVYAFSRRNALPQGFTTRDMARDLARAMEQLGIEKADVFGVSMGGMIAQHLAIDYPQKVGRLVLAVTSARSNPTLEASIGEWVACARSGDHVGFTDSNMRLIYSDAYYRKNRWTVPLVGLLTKPKTYDRFYIQADACLTHDTFAALPQIQVETLVVGGEQDKALGGEASKEIAARIPGARLHMYSRWGHGLYEEATDFNATVLQFLTNP